jgi:RmlD substrate binding domain
MKPAILLIGPNGQVGRELNSTLPRIGEVTTLDRQRLDLTQPEEQLAPSSANESGFFASGVCIPARSSGRDSSIARILPTYFPW